MHGMCLLQMLFPPLLNPWCMQRQLAVRRCPLASPPRTIAAERPVETADQRTANGASAQAQVRRTCGRLPELSLAEDPCPFGLETGLDTILIFAPSDTRQCSEQYDAMKKACEDHESAHW